MKIKWPQAEGSAHSDEPNDASIFDTIHISARMHAACIVHRAQGCTDESHVHHTEDGSKDATHCAGTAITSSVPEHGEVEEGAH